MAEQNFVNESLDWIITDMKLYVEPDKEQIYKDRKFKAKTMQVTQINRADGVIRLEDGNSIELVPQNVMPKNFEICVGKS